MVKKFKRELSSLTLIFKYIKEFVESQSLSKSISVELSLAGEEIFTNIVKYSNDDTSPVLLTLVRSNKGIVEEFKYSTLLPYDITKIKEYNPGLPLRDRPVGGLGIHLVKNMFDDIHFDYKDRNCKITLIKYVGVSDV